MSDFTHINQFPQTRWSLVERSSKSDVVTRQKALEELCRLYWPPVYAFVRSKGNTPHDAEDLVQGFFSKLLSRDDFSGLDSSKGKLRSFLLTSVKNYMVNEWQKATRQKRGGGIAVFSLNQDEAEESCLVISEAKDEATPEVIFQRQWILTLLAHVLEKLEARYQDEGKADLFAALKPGLSLGAPTDSYSEIAHALKMSESAVKVAAHRLRHRYAQLLRSEIADTLGPDEDPDTEIAALMGSF